MAAIHGDFCFPDEKSNQGNPDKLTGEENHELVEPGKMNSIHREEEILIEFVQEICHGRAMIITQ